MKVKVALLDNTPCVFSLDWSDQDITKYVEKCLSMGSHRNCPDVKAGKYNLVISVTELIEKKGEVKTK